MFTISRLLGLSLVAAMLAAQPTLAAAEATDATLFTRLGGQPVISAVADDLIDRTSHEDKLKRSFAKSDIPRIKRLLGEQLCALTGGPCKYSGDSMAEVHAGFNIRQDEFYGMVEILESVLRQHDIGLRERNELLALLAPMKRDVVTR